MSNSGWLIERTSMWGAEWFCAGSARWTRDSEKAIRFPDKETADEMWNALRISHNRPKVSFPYEEEGGGEWVYRYDITDHLWVNEPSQLLEDNERLIQELAQAKEQLATREDDIAAKVLEEAATYVNTFDFGLDSQSGLVADLLHMAQERRNRGT